MAVAQPLDETIGYIGALSLYRFAKKQELIDTLVLHMVYTRKKTAFTQYVHELIQHNKYSAGRKLMPNTMGSI